MNENELLRSLASFIKEVFKNFWLEEEREVDPTIEPGSEEEKAEKLNKPFGPPRVYFGFLPPKSSEVNDFPFILLRPSNGEICEDYAKMEISILIGCWAEDGKSIFDCLNVMDKLRMSLRNLPAQTLENRYILDPTIPWETTEEQPWPYSILRMDTTWRFRAPVAVHPQFPEFRGY